MEGRRLGKAFREVGSFLLPALVNFSQHGSDSEMKLIRMGEVGQEKPGVLLEDGTRLDVAGLGSDYDEAFFAGDGITKLRNWMTAHGRSAPRVSSAVRWGPPVCRPSKIVCIGLNFRDHAEESGMEIPKEPVIFFKATSALAGPNDFLVIPKNATKVDWEVELAIVMENGELRQKGSTSKMIFDVPALVAYVSEFMTLLPGDVISTGTPSGVGLGMKPP